MVWLNKIIMLLVEKIIKNVLSGDEKDGPTLKLIFATAILTIVGLLTNVFIAAEEEGKTADYNVSSIEKELILLKLENCTEDLSIVEAKLETQVKLTNSLVSTIPKDKIIIEPVIPQQE